MVWHFVEDPKARQKIVSTIWLPICFAIDCQFVLLSMSGTACHAKSRKPVLANHVDAMLVCNDCQWWAKFDLAELGPIHCGFQGVEGGPIQLV